MNTDDYTPVHLLAFRTSEGIYLLETWDTGRMAPNTGTILAYRLWREGFRPIFEGEDFTCSPILRIGSNKVAGALLTFLTLGEGDTDDEYFHSYSARQIKFRDSDARESLALEAEKLTEG